MRSTRCWRVVATTVALVATMGVVACGDSSGSSGATSSGADDFLGVVKASIKAENAKDADAFLKLWTDKGLESYDAGTRDEIKSGKSENFGTDEIKVTTFGTPKVTGSTASVDLEAVVGHTMFATPVNLVTLEGVLKDGTWLLDGFVFKGSPPPAAGTDVVKVTATEYAFTLDKATADHKVAFRFVNAGKEQHELTLFKTPAGVTLEAAKAALEHVDGSELKDIPAGYEVSHISFAEVGESHDVTFADALPAGSYALVCYIPQGGFGDDGPVNPAGAPHISLGMIALLTLR